MEFIPTSLPGVILIRPQSHEDERGFLVESFRADGFEAAGIPGPFVQENHSRSRRGVLRGLHYQLRANQGKLVRAVTGTVFDVAVDLRRSSPSFGRWVGLYISGEDRDLIWIPPGFAHGMYVLSESADVLYKMTDYYAPEWERTLLWSDPTLGIEWPLIDGAPPILSPKDRQGVPLAGAEVFD
jgi:dTDP-4-dehydrorhamnose 3,5-epimerase